jgi:hypothetical protein
LRIDVDHRSEARAPHRRGCGREEVRRLGGEPPRLLRLRDELGPVLPS